MTKKRILLLAVAAAVLLIAGAIAYVVSTRTFPSYKPGAGSRPAQEEPGQPENPEMPAEEPKEVDLAPVSPEEAIGENMPETNPFKVEANPYNSYANPFGEAK